MTDQTQPLPLKQRVHDLAVENGATFTANTFDGGTFYKVTQPGKGSVAVSYEYGDDEDQIIEVLRSKMVGAGMIGGTRHEFLLDYGSGNTARIWASDKTQAVRLASRGEPETVTDLTTGDVVEWVAPA